MPRGQPILQNLSQILSKLICSPTHRDNFMETPSNFAKKYNFIPVDSQTALKHPPRALNECQEDYQFYTNPIKLYQK
jgi:hypothetical protein